MVQAVVVHRAADLIPDHVLAAVLLRQGQRAGTREGFPPRCRSAANTQACTNMSFILSSDDKDICNLYPPGSELTSSSHLRPRPSTCLGRVTVQEVTEF